MPPDHAVRDSSISFLAGLLVRLVVWVSGLGVVGWAIGTVIKGSHPGALLAIPSAAAGLIAFCIHAVILIWKRQRTPARDSPPTTSADREPRG